MNIKDIPVEELIQRINDNIDIYAFPHSQISDIDDEKSWDNLGEYIGGYELMQITKKEYQKGLNGGYMIPSKKRYITLHQNRRF